MRHKFLVLTVKKLLKSVYIYGSYRKIKTGLSLFWTTLYSGWPGSKAEVGKICWFFTTSRIFQPLALENLCTINSVTLTFVNDLDQRICTVSLWC